MAKFIPTFFIQNPDPSFNEWSVKASKEASDKLLMWLKGYEMEEYNVYPGSLGAYHLTIPIGDVMMVVEDGSPDGVLCYQQEPVDEAFMAKLYGIYEGVDWDLLKPCSSKVLIWSRVLIWVAFIFQDPEKARKMLELLSYLDPIEELPSFKDFYDLLEGVLEKVEELEELERLQLDSTFWLWVSLKSHYVKTPEVITREKHAVTVQPSWVEDKAWELYHRTRPWEAAEILNLVVEDVIKYAQGRVIVCLARDFLWLYALLVERGVPAYLAVCSRLNIGDSQTLEIIREELQGKGVSLQNCLFVDSQGQGSIYDWMRAEFNLPAENFAFLYSCSKEYKGICQHRLTREEVIDKVEHRLIHPVGRSHGWVYHEGLGWQPVWQTRELNQYSVRCIQQVRALTCLHMGVSEAWNSCMGHTAYERTMGLTLAKDEFPEVYIRVTNEAWESIQKEGYKTLRETGYSMGKDLPHHRDSYEQKAFRSIVDPLYGYRDNPQRWIRYGNVILRLKEEYLKFCTSTPGDSLMLDLKGADVLPLAWSTHEPRWESQEVQIHTFLPPQALEVFVY